MNNSPFSSIALYELKNSNGMRVGITNYGGIVVYLYAPDREGKLEDVVLGHNTLEEYINSPSKPYFGAIVGRVGNRIANGRFELDGEVYELAQNNKGNHLHGGLQGYDKVVWTVLTSSEQELTLGYKSYDGEEGYPGKVDLQVAYELTEANELVISYRATTDKATPLALTNHTYFNLAGEAAGEVLDHVVEINADAITAVDEKLVPTGELLNIAGTVLDFRSAKRIGQDIKSDSPLLADAEGFDHNYILNPGEPDNLNYCARVYEPVSGRLLEVFTTEPGVQFYTGNSLDGLAVGKSGKPYGQFHGFCLETQHFPDSVNHPEFPSTILRPDEQYFSRTIYLFSAE